MNMKPPPELDTLSKEDKDNLQRLSQTMLPLCRGGEFIPVEEKSRLLCRYSSGKHSSLLIGPMKEEEVYLNPRIVVYHDFLTPREIETIKDMSIPSLGCHNVGQVYTRTNHLTGLNMEACEELSVTNSRIGEVYGPHYDNDHYAGVEMVATLLMYLSEVDMGGSTVFPFLGISIRPRIGSAVFWYNLHRSGEVDHRTLHAACPILAGTKWIANLWIQERGQEMARPCSTDPLV